MANKHKNRPGASTVDDSQDKALQAENVPTTHSMMRSGAAKVFTPEPTDLKVQVQGGIPKVFFSQQALAKMWHIVDICTQEVSWFGTVTTVDAGFFVEDIYLVEQTVSGAETEMTENGLAALATQLVDEGKEELLDRLRLWGHSHVGMECGPSGQDSSQMDKFKATGYPWMLRLIANKKGCIRIGLYIYLSDITVTFLNLSWEVFNEADDNLRASLEEEIKTKVTSAYQGNWNGRVGGHGYPPYTGVPQTSQQPKNPGRSGFDSSHDEYMARRGAGNGSTTPDPRRFGLGGQHSPPNANPGGEGTSDKKIDAAKRTVIDVDKLLSASKTNLSPKETEDVKDEFDLLVKHICANSQFRKAFVESLFGVALLEMATERAKSNIIQDIKTVEVVGTLLQCASEEIISAFAENMDGVDITDPGTTYAALYCAIYGKTTAGKRDSVADAEAKYHAIVTGMAQERSISEEEVEKLSGDDIAEEVGYVRPKGVSKGPDKRVGVEYNRLVLHVSQHSDVDRLTVAGCFGKAIAALAAENVQGGVDKLPIDPVDIVQAVMAGYDPAVNSRYNECLSKMKTDNLQVIDGLNKTSRCFYSALFLTVCGETAEDVKSLPQTTGSVECEEGAITGEDESLMCVLDDIASAMELPEDDIVAVFGEGARILAVKLVKEGRIGDDFKAIELAEAVLSDPELVGEQHAFVELHNAMGKGATEKELYGALYALLMQSIPVQGSEDVSPKAGAPNPIEAGQRRKQK